jgi:hypothetical protein
VFLAGIGWYFLGIVPIYTKEKLGWYILICKFGGNLFFTQKGGIGPLFDASQPPFWGIYKVPAKLFKNRVPAKSQLGKKN